MKIIVDTMYTHVDYGGNTLLQEKVRNIAHIGMGVKVDGAFYSRAYKSGVWDGITDFYDMKEDKFHTGLLHQFLDCLRKLQEKDPNLTYEIEDIRPPQVVHPDSIDEEIVLGNGDEEPITLRDYQYESVKNVFKEQVGIVNISTNGGKCLVEHSELLTSEGIMTIGELFRRSGHDPVVREDVIPYTGDIQLVNRYGKLEKPSHLTFNGMRKVREIKSHRGMQNTVTLNHPLLTVSKDGTFQWKEAKDIQVGDYLVGRIGDNVYGTSNLVDEEEAYALGAITADGHVPQCILEAPKNIQLAFLSGYLESECNLNNQKGCIDVASTSYTLINQVSLMLRNIGYVPTVRKKIVKGYEHNDCYVLALGSSDSLSLLEELTFISDNRKEFTIPNSTPKTRLRGLLNEYDKGDQELYKNPPILADSPYTFEQVIEVRDVEEQPTFDVCMPETHSFIAEGIINHNTEVASGVIQQILPYIKRGERIAFFTHSKEILHQSANRIAKRLGMKPKDIGKIGDGKFDIKNKKLVFVMVPTLVSALKDPKKDVKFTQKERIVKLIAEDIVPKFRNTKNTRQLLRNYIKNCKLTTKVWQAAEEQLMYIAYDNKFTDRTAQMQLNKYAVEFDKIMEKKNKNKYKKYKETLEFIESVKVMIADEVHHSKADTWYSSLSLCKNATYRIGLTGTVDKSDKMGWQRLQAIFSQVIVRVSNEYLIDRGVSSKPTIRLVPITEPRNIELLNNYMEAYKAGIVENETRNDVIVSLVAAYKKRKPGGILISVKEIDHGDRILEKLREKGLEAEFIHGGSDDDHRSGCLEKFSQGELKILIASTIIDEGVDMKSIGCMVLAAGGKSMRQQLQRIGRGLRLNGIDGNRVLVFDFFDATNKYLLNHSKERIKIFKEEKFDVKKLGE